MLRARSVLHSTSHRCLTGSMYLQTASYLAALNQIRSPLQAWGYRGGPLSTVTSGQAGPETFTDRADARGPACMYAFLFPRCRLGNGSTFLSQLASGSSHLNRAKFRIYRRLKPAMCNHTRLKSGWSSRFLALPRLRPTPNDKST